VRGLESLRIYRPQYVFEDAFDVSYDIVVPVTKDEIATCFQIVSPLRVLPLLGRMLAAIEFDNEFGIRATEISDEAVDRHLPTELPAIEPTIAQSEPQ
jgi:hypothetical protein